MEELKDKIIFSGIQPSGSLHIGNYLGAIKQWINLEKYNNTYYCIVDEHAITADYDIKKISDYILDTAALYLAAGLNPEKSIIFIQSHVSAHTELAWLLSTITPIGELERMTQFKDKKTKQENKPSVGLFTYPILMAADILLYQTEIVPVGDDQTQHLELTRDIARKFNNKFGDTFVTPKPFINKDTARIMSLTNPDRKMSKSDPEKSYIALTDNPDTIKNKIKSATTETETTFSFKNSGPAVKNLLNIYKAFSEKTESEIEKEFINKNYKDFKDTLAETIINKLAPLQKKYHEIRKNDDELRIVLARGQHRAEQTAKQTLQEVKGKMGIG